MFLYFQKKNNKNLFYVSFAIIPGFALQVYYIGYGVLIQFLISITIAILIEFFLLKTKIFKKNIDFFDYSSLFTALILCISIPPLSNWILITIATLFSIILGKYIYGGFSNNIFNPAMIGYIFILIFFPNYISKLWLINNTVSFFDSLRIIFLGEKINYFFRTEFDEITRATPLNILHYNFNINNFFHHYYYWIFINIAFLLGGIFLILKKIISYYILIGIFISFFLFFIKDYIFFSKSILFLIIYLFSGGTMIGVFFVATDPITSTINSKGSLILGILIGTLFYCNRNLSFYPDGIAFGIILVNIFVPFINYVTIVYQKKI